MTNYCWWCWLCYKATLLLMMMVAMVRVAVVMIVAVVVVDQFVVQQLTLDRQHMLCPNSVLMFVTNCLHCYCGWVSLRLRFASAHIGFWFLLCKWELIVVDCDDCYKWMLLLFLCMIVTNRFKNGKFNSKKKLTYNCHVHVMDYGHVANDFSMLNAVFSLSALANCSTMEVAGVAVRF